VRAPIARIAARTSGSGSNRPVRASIVGSVGPRYPGRRDDIVGAPRFGKFARAHRRRAQICRNMSLRH
jgi:hypothetical protein